MTTPPRPTAVIGWRLLALLYDFFPVLGLWFLAALLFTLLHGDAVRGGVLGLLEFFVLWTITGLYATLSWRRGGQTIGMRPWRLQVVSALGTPPTARMLWLRYSVGTLSLLTAGMGFWWAWIDRNRLTWHDRASKTRLIRQPASSSQ